MDEKPHTTSAPNMWKENLFSLIIYI